MGAFIQKIKYTKPVMKAYSFVMKRIQRCTIPVDVPEVRPLAFRPMDSEMKKMRMNLLVPSLDKEHVFGGIATAISFFKELCNELKCDCRYVILDADVAEKTMVDIGEYNIVSYKENSKDSIQVVGFNYRANQSLVVGDKDYFMATSWWSAYLAEPIIKWQKDYYQADNALLYFIQDYEPGFYPWSSRYLMAESTYKMDIDVMGVFNSKLLYDYFDVKGYTFTQKWYFEPALNEHLNQYLNSVKEYPERKNQILIYGRPGTARNAFELIMEALREWVKIQPNVNEWTVLSAGEPFDDVDLGNGMKVHSLGKLSLDDYAQTMLESKIGISLMVSPHPSYPPLEMAAFGMKVITNSFENKNLGSFNKNIVSISSCSSGLIAQEVKRLCNGEIGYIFNDKLNVNNDKWSRILYDLKNYYHKY